jgi:molybdopterin-guanine dinucleotide biosynthesis protein A
MSGQYFEHPGIAGIILAGGRSSRMGQDKALLPMPGLPARTFVEHLATLLQPHCTEILVVARDSASAERLATLPTATAWRTVCDQQPDQGPLMGLASGLQAITTSHALVLAVDLPCVQPALLAYLCALPLDDQIIMPCIEEIPQVLLARYPRSILPIITRNLAQGRRDPRSLLPKVPVAYLNEMQLRPFDPHLHSFINVNTPDDLLAVGILD